MVRWFIVIIFSFLPSIGFAQYEAKAYCVHQLPGFGGYDIDTKTGFLRGSPNLACDTCFGENNSKLQECIKNYKPNQQNQINKQSNEREFSKPKMEPDKPKQSTVVNNPVTVSNINLNNVPANSLVNSDNAVFINKRIADLEAQINIFENVIKQQKDIKKVKL